MKYLISFIFFGIVHFSFAQQWKKLANDLEVNLYDVVEEAEIYFKNIDKSKKGSGWKSYQRWLYENEPKYYPSGNRNTINPYFVAKEYKNFIENNTVANQMNTTPKETKEIRTTSLMRIALLNFLTKR